jgi:hypothetical protein
VFSLKIKQAETALGEGRLDEACQLLSDPQLRSHRRGQALITQVTHRLRHRIEEHLQQSQFEAALQDCHRALALAGNLPELEQLRASAAEELQREQRQQAQERELLLAARQCVAEGEFSRGRELCGRLPERIPQRAELSARIHQQRQTVESALTRAQQAWQRKAIHETVAALREVQKLAPQNHALPVLKTEVLDRLCTDAHRAIEQGHLSRADALLQLASSLDAEDLQVTDELALLRRGQRAAEQIEANDFGAAWETLRVLAQLVPGSSWIEETLRWAQQAQEARQALRGCPLFALSHGPDFSLTEKRNREVHPVRSALGFLPGTPDAAVPARFLLQVDGAGRFLVHRPPAVRLGSHRDADPVDIDWSGTELEYPLILERMEEDYFMRSKQPVRVNGKPVTSALLTDGDRLFIGSRGAIKFVVPCAASHSAVLQFSGIRLHPSDARGVILMDEAIVIAPTHHAHVRVRELQRGFVLFHRQERLWIRHLDGSDGQESPRAVRLGDPVSLGSASLVVIPAAD